VRRRDARALRPAGARDGLACLVTAVHPPRLHIHPHSAALGANLRVPPAMHPPLAEWPSQKKRLLLAVVARRRRPGADPASTLRDTARTARR